jgi:hypothetical protein
LSANGRAVDLDAQGSFAAEAMLITIVRHRLFGVCGIRWYSLMAMETPRVE